jgi:23S rRNA (uracil1939-C5)-methyltransferase
MTEQRALKLAHLRSIWAEAPTDIAYRSAGPSSLRDRVDFMIDRKPGGNARFGLFDRFKTGIVDLQGCPQLSPALETWFQEFRHFDFSLIARGSVRLRVSPSGVRGAWLDFANVDVKTLLDDGRVLRALLASNVIVEIGQRRKRLVERDGLLKLADPVLAPWFETYVDGVATPLFCTIGSFTQPGFAMNRMLVDEVMSLVPSAGARAAEFGAGIGNFTLALAARFREVDAYEVDSLALEGLALAKPSGVTVHSGNYQGDKALALDFSQVDCLLVDPPRSGLMKFVDPVASARKLIYVSCFAESFAADSARLREFGFQVDHAMIIDQFPQSRHYEIAASFSRA